MLRRFTIWACLLLGATTSSAPLHHLEAQPSAIPPRATATEFRTLSWNVGYRRFRLQKAQFVSLVRAADPDLLILDEVGASATAAEIRELLNGLRGPADTVWHVVMGAGGGVQHGVIASREPVTLLPHFERMAYPDSAVSKALELTPDSARAAVLENMRAGIGATGAIVRVGRRSLLAVAVDFVCCGNDAGSAQEFRRRIEAREIRGALQRALREHRVDGVIVAGDFNLVNSASPLATLTQPYPAPHLALVAADAVQLDGRDLWTWDGRGSPFPSGVLDFVLFSPVSLTALRATPLSTEDVSNELLERFGLTSQMTREFSEHLPVIADFKWRSSGNRR